MAKRIAAKTTATVAPIANSTTLNPGALQGNIHLSVSTRDGINTAAIQKERK